MTRVLIIDDDDDEILLLRGLLEQFRGGTLEILAQTDPALGLDALLRADADVYLVDYRLGAVSGLDLLRAARAAGCDRPIILLTGVKERTIDIEAMEAGASDYLVKSDVNAENLERAIRYASRHAAALDAASEGRRDAERLVSELATANAELERLSTTDQLTGLFNYRRLMERFEDEFERARRGAGPLSVAMIDVDHFKHYNDTNGHEAGNAALREIAMLLTPRFRKIDILGRYGGEELCAVLPNTYGAGALVCAERARLAVARHSFAFGANQPLGFVSVSVGVATLSPGDESVSTLLERADKALYEAKRRGRNQVGSAEIDVLDGSRPENVRR